MSNFTCHSCQEQIPPQNARLHCQTCPNYDICTNCYVIGQISGSHTAQHPTMVYQQSGQLPPPAPGSGDGIQRGTQAANPTSASWDTLFNPDQSPTPLFSSIIAEFFRHLDPSQTGCLIPEAYAYFIETQGQPLEHNIWKDAYSKALNNKFSSADQALKQVFDMFSVDYILRDRLGAGQQPQFPIPFIASTSFPPQTTQMPLLTLHGFTKAVTVDTYTNPDGWIYLNRALKYYQLPIWKERGDVPKALVPDVSPEVKQNMEGFQGQLDGMQVQTGARVENEALNGWGFGWVQNF